MCVRFASRRGSGSRLLQEADDQGQQGADDRRQAAVGDVAAAEEAGESRHQARQELAADAAADEARIVLSIGPRLRFLRRAPMTLPPALPAIRLISQLMIWGSMRV
jgi:hypothetical protein